MPRSGGSTRPARRLSVGATLLVACVGLLQAADAAKPSTTAPVTLTAVDPYLETELFDTAAIQDAVNETLTDYEVDHVDLFGGYTSIAQQSSGVLLVEFEAYDIVVSSMS